MRNASRVLLAILVLSAAACAAKQDTASPPAPNIAQSSVAGIRVINDGSAFLDLVVFLIPDNGVKQMIGEVKAGQTMTFQHELKPGNYTLEQQRTDGTSRSNRFYVAADNKLVIWTISSNRVQTSK